MYLPTPNNKTKSIILASMFSTHLTSKPLNTTTKSRERLQKGKWTVQKDVKAQLWMSWWLKLRLFCLRTCKKSREEHKQKPGSAVLCWSDRVLSKRLTGKSTRTGKGVGRTSRTAVAPLVCDWSLASSFRANALHCGAVWRKWDGRGGARWCCVDVETGGVVFWCSGISTGWILNFGRNRNCEFLRMRGEESSDSESGRMEESSVRRSLETLCQELNMDEQTATEAMENFTAIWNTYTLEVSDGTPLFWCKDSDWS